MRLGQVLKKWRLMSDINTRDAGAQIGISASAILRIESGKVPDGETLIKLLQWLMGTEPQANAPVAE